MDHAETNEIRESYITGAGPTIYIEHGHKSKINTHLFVPLLGEKQCDRGAPLLQTHFVT